MIFEDIRVLSKPTSSARNGNLEAPVLFLKAKQGYAIRNMGKDECINIA
jgi:hypothetical protein